MNYRNEWVGGSLSFLLLLLLLSSCMEPQTSSESPAKGLAISGRLLDAQGKPVRGAKVTIFPADHVPSASAKAVASSGDTSDANGNFKLSNLEPGTYNITGVKDTLGAFIDSIGIAANSKTI